MIDLTLYSDVIYVVIMLIAAILLAWWTVRKFISTGKTYQDRREKNQEFREGRGISTVIFVIVLWLIYIVVGIAAWQFKGDRVETETFENPAQVEEIEKIMEHEPAPDDELVERKNELVEKRDIKPHEEKLDAFEERMRLEAEKIRKRNDPNQRQ